MKKIFLLTLCCSLLAACSALREADAAHIGKYEMTSVTQTDKEKPQLVCAVYDMQSNGLMVGAAVVTSDSVSGNITNLDGICTFEVPNGTYRLTAFYTGFTQLQTKRIKFYPYTKTKIKFYLGSFPILCQ